jgi:phosphate/sulfate permease
VRQHQLACPRCGFETGFAPLTITARGGADACPMCDRLLPAAVIIESLRRLEHENPTLLDYLIEKIDRRVARQKIIRWVALLTASVLIALIVYLLFSPFF